MWKELAWPSLSSLRPSPRCPSLPCGLSSSSSCSSASASPQCSAAWREWWCLCRTSKSCPGPGLKKFTAVTVWQKCKKKKKQNTKCTKRFFCSVLFLIFRNFVQKFWEDSLCYCIFFQGWLVWYLLDWGSFLPHALETTGLLFLTTLPVPFLFWLLASVKWLPSFTSMASTGKIKCEGFSVLFCFVFGWENFFHFKNAIHTQWT